jgi:hypothetical protein
MVCAVVQAFPLIRPFRYNPRRWGREDARQAQLAPLFLARTFEYLFERTLGFAAATIMRLSFAVILP